MHEDLLIIGGYGEVGRRLAARLQATHRVRVGGRNGGVRVDVDDPGSVARALDGIGTVVVCVRQHDAHVLRAAVRRGLAYTSVAPPRMDEAQLAALDEEARQTGARVVVGAGLEPGIASILARVAADRAAPADEIETALLLSTGDIYGPDSMAFIFEELADRYSMLIGGDPVTARAFDASAPVAFPPPVGARTAYTMPFSDQTHYPRTLGVRTAIARIALDPPWSASILASVVSNGGRNWLAHGYGRRLLRAISARLRERHEGEDRFALVVDVHGAWKRVRATLVGHEQANATALGAAGVVHGLATVPPGVWMAEQVIAPAPFIERMTAEGLVPIFEEEPFVPAARRIQAEAQLRT
jgi:hypothetical protein